MPRSLYMGPTRETMSGFRGGMQSRQIGKLMQGAQMGDPKAMEGLYMMDPQTAMAIKQQRDKQGALASQNNLSMFHVKHYLPIQPVSPVPDSLTNNVVPAPPSLFR